MKKAFLIICLLVVFLPVFGYAQNEEELKKAIDAKTQELREIHQQIQETQDQLVTAGAKKTSLTSEIGKNNYTISQLRLSLKSNEINIDKLGLEISSVSYEILDAQEKIKNKSGAINNILRELQIKDDENLIIIFLKNQSLADSLTEVNNLKELKLALKNDIENLQNLKLELGNHLDQVSTNKKGIEREHQTATVRKSLLEEKQVENRELLALTKSQEKAYEQLIDELAERQADIAQEIEQFEAELRKKINPTLLPPERPGVLSWPIDDGYKKLTQNYGATAFARYGYVGKWHNGVDIGSPMGTPVIAPADGLVFSTGDQDKYCRKGAYGKFIVIKHDNNLATLYAHLSNIKVSPGDKVERGEVIGYVGSTGYSTGPHLHFTVYDGNTLVMKRSNSCGPMPYGGDIDPVVYL